MRNKLKYSVALNNIYQFKFVNNVRLCTFVFQILQKKPK